MAGFWWKAIYENVYKRLHKNTENFWSPFCHSYLEVFLREKVIFDFFLAEGHSTTFLKRACTQKIPCLRVFLEKDYLSFSVKRKNIVFPQKQTSSFQIINKLNVLAWSFWKDHLFKTHEENITFPWVFLRKFIFHFPSKG